MIRRGSNGKITLHDGFPTLLFINLQTCEKFGINPLEYFAGKNEDWLSLKGRSMKILLLAYHQICADEEKRISESMNKSSNTRTA